MTVPDARLLASPAPHTLSPSRRGEPSVDALAQAFADAACITQARAKNFYYGLRLTPEPRRSAVYAIYAWMRAGDDAVDDAPSPAARRAALSILRDATAAALAGDPEPGRGAPHPLGGDWWLALTHTIATYHLPASIFTDTLDGLAADTQASGPPADLPTLETYCRRVAGTAGRACVRIWGPPSDRASATHVITPAALDDLADELGIAFQLTNILRDIREDAAPPINRVYLPLSLLAEHGLTPQDVVAWRSADDARCRAVVLTLARRAERAFAAADAIAPNIHPDCRPTLRAMTAIYRAILDQIIADPRRCVAPASGRARVPTWRKLAIMLRALAVRTLAESRA